MAALGNDPVNAVNLNLPSVNAPVMPGKLTTTRTATNVSGKQATYRVETTAPSGAKITVSPSTFTLAAGASVALKITITSGAPKAQYFGQVRLVPTTAGLPTLHLPVAYVTKQGDVTVTQSCAPTAINVLATTTCTTTAANQTFGDTTADLTTTSSFNLPVVGASGATVDNLYQVSKKGVALKGAVPGTPSVAQDGQDNYLPLDQFGGTITTAVGDEQFVNFNVPAFLFNGISYSSISINSNGYLVPGTATGEDDNCCSLHGIPDPARPNNVLAPFWTDLNGAGAPGVLVNVLTDGTNNWTVIEWRVFDFGTTNSRIFQIWLGDNGVQDITFDYKLSTMASLPAGQPLQIGAENINGTGGGQLPTGTLPTSEIRVTSSAPVPGQTVSYTTTLLGILPGAGKVTTQATSPVVPGTTVVSSNVKVSLKLIPPTRKMF
jgi:hypothetical protein